VGIPRRLTSRVDALAAGRLRCGAACIMLACCLASATLIGPVRTGLAQKPDPFQSVAPDPARAAAKPAPQRRALPAPHLSKRDETTPSAPLPQQRSLSLSVPQDALQPSYDGNYIGKAQATSDSRNWCASSGNRNLTIKHGQFTYIFNATRDEKIVGSVNQDGSLHARGNAWHGGNELIGKIDQNRFSGSVGNYYCLYTLILTKVE
jgi:hypothetical protein